MEIQKGDPAVPNSGAPQITPPTTTPAETPQNQASPKLTKWQINRRFKGGLIVIALVTFNFYFCIYKKIPLDWFKSYADTMGWIGGILLGGLTATDIAAKRKP